MEYFNKALMTLTDGKWWDYLSDSMPEDVKNELCHAIDLAEQAMRCGSLGGNPLQYQNELYRAKVQDTDDWIIGFYFFHNWYLNGEITDVSHYIKPSICADSWTIRPDTLGKAIGKLDINGKLIFSGDIVKFYNNASQPDDYITCVIEWETEKFRWCIYAIEENKRFSISPTGKYEVIGNVVDNPDLIEITV